MPARGAEAKGFGRQPFGEGDNLRIGSRSVKEALQDAELSVEHAHGQVRQLAGVLQVGPDALVQFPASMRRRRLGPRCGHEGQGVTCLQRQSTRLGRLLRAHGRIGRAEGRGAAVGQRFAQPSFDAVRPHAHQRLQRALRIALFAQVVRHRLIGDAGGCAVGGHRSRIAHRIQGPRAQVERLGMTAVEGDQRLQMAQRIAEGGQAHRVSGCCEEPGHGFARAPSVEPVACHHGWRGVEFSQALRGLAV